MQRFMNADSAYAWIEMQRQVDKRLFLLVEGDDEHSILFGHVSSEDIAILVLGGKPNVLTTSRLLESRPIKGVMPMIDRDLDDLTGQSAHYPTGITVTRSYDLVSDVISVRPDLLERAASVHGKDSYESVGHTAGSFLDACYELCFVLAALRLVNVEKCLGLNLRDFPFDGLVCADYGPKSTAEFIRVANGRSSVSVDVTHIEALVMNAATRIDNVRHYCGGHDLVRAAAAILRKAGARGVGAKDLALSLITATDCKTISQIPITENLSSWADGYSRAAFNCEWTALN